MNPIDSSFSATNVDFCGFELKCLVILSCEHVSILTLAISSVKESPTWLQILKNRRLTAPTQQQEQRRYKLYFRCWTNERGLLCWKKKTQSTQSYVVYQGKWMKCWEESHSTVLAFTDSKLPFILYFYDIEMTCIIYLFHVFWRAVKASHFHNACIEECFCKMNLAGTKVFRKEKLPVFFGAAPFCTNPPLLVKGFERRPLKHPSFPDGAERDSGPPKPPRTGTVPALVPKPPSYPLVKLVGKFYTLKCRWV